MQSSLSFKFLSYYLLETFFNFSFIKHIHTMQKFSINAIFFVLSFIKHIHIIRKFAINAIFFVLNIQYHTEYPISY